MEEGRELNEPGGSEAGSEALLSAVRQAIAERRRWTPPIVIVRYQDPAEIPAGESSYLAVTQADLAIGRWPGKGRQYEIVAEFDAEELEDLEDYSEEDLQHYVSTVLLW